MRLRLVFIVIGMIVLLKAPAQNYERLSSILSDGTLLKIGIPREGAYKITASQLSNFGIQDINSEDIKLYGEGGMLPQSNEEEVFFDPPESSIWIEDGNDGTFNNEDYLLFYAEGPDEIQYSGEVDFFNLRRNYYSDTAWYFLKISEDQSGKRISESELVQSQGKTVNTYSGKYYLEPELNSRPFLSGREWFGDKFSITSISRSYSFSTPPRVNNSTLKINSQILGFSFEETTMDVEVNGVTVGKHIIPRSEDYRYASQGVIISDTFAITSSIIPEGDLTVTLNFSPVSSSRISEAYQDKLIVMSEHPLQLLDSPLIFETDEEESIALSITDLKSNQVLWDITDPLKPQIIQKSENNTYNVENGYHKFLSFTPDQVNEVQNIKNQENQNIKDVDVPDLLIVTHPDFRLQAEKLANFRSDHDNYDVVVVDIFQIYNEFSSGKPDISAIRNYARYLYHRVDAPQKLKYLLLFGKGTYDHKNQRKANVNFVPIYESRNSLHPLLSYGSDDYFGFMEENEGFWEENDDGNHSLDLGVGRLPVKSTQEAENVVKKLINYENEETIGDWRKKVLFVADDGDFNIHMNQSEQLAEYIDTTFNRFNNDKLYLDAFTQEPSASGEKSPEMYEELFRRVEEGALLVNYTGHGGESGWMQEAVLDQFMVTSWKNIDKLPLFVTATCEFGKHDSPLRISSGELTLLNPNGGGIGLVTTSRPVLSSSNFRLNKAFYSAVFKTESDRSRTLGDVFKETKNNALIGVGNRNFALLGDPSMTLAYPENTIDVTGIFSDGNPGDTLSAQSKVKFTGEIIDFEGERISSFDGIVNFSLYDKASLQRTLGNESTPYSFKTWSNLIFKGQAEVSGGEFSIEMVIPKNINYTPGNGRVSMYAVSDDGRDASGTELNFKIGGSAENNVTDTEPPIVNLYMGDTSFEEGGATLPNTRLIARISDENGINISNFGIGQGLKLTLDGERVWEVNDYYTADIGDYTSGTLDFPLFNLSPGEHKIELTVFDTFNNSSTGVVTFEVTDKEILSLQKLRGYPNPFSDHTSIRFEHNRAGEDLEILYNIISAQGKIVSDGTVLMRNAPATVELFNWNGTGERNTKVDNGLYYLILDIRSLQTGAKNKIYTKLIVQN